MIVHSVWQKSFGFFGKPVVVTPSEATLSSDARLLPIRQFDEAIGLTRQFTGALSDLRYWPSVKHGLLEMVRMRVYGIVAGYPDQNDHDVLRGDPVFKLIAGRSPTDDDLASQPTLSRFENAIDVKSLRRLQDVLIDQFVASFDKPPTQLTLDIDPFDDPTHGDQQLTFFHSYYRQYQYLPRAITCAENDQVAMICLLYGTAHPALGADDDISYLVGRLRDAFPGVRIHLRADSGLGVPKMYRVCEHLDIDYTIGIGMNATLKNWSEPLLSCCVEEFQATGQPQRKFTAGWYRAGSWPAQRRIVIKCEANAQGTNRRAVVTNRSGARVLPGASCDAYADRGESENRNKELKCGLSADRLSDHRYMANLFRLYLHVVAHNLLVRLRRLVADPPSPDLRTLDEDPLAGVPLQARPRSHRRRYYNQRRKCDPLGEGHPCTWQTRLIKVAARITVSARRVVVELSGSWPYTEHYRRVSTKVLGFSTPSLDTS